MTLSPTARAAFAEAQRILRARLGDRARVLLFGSWARGAPRRASDLDLGILPKAPLPEGLLSELRADFDESDIPYRVDVVDLSRTTARVRENALAEGIVWIE